ncbi:MAG: hypothetical protein KGI25_09630 [Thaumarchaeota archaeon]|nr:hypothetical protein [Nitrososphaerota archaeon]
MSDDTISKVKSLIDSKKGDPQRLQQILDTLTQGKPLEISDQDYLQELTKELPQPEPESKDGTEPESLDLPKTEGISDEQAIHETRNSPSRKKVAIIASVIAAIVIAYVGLDVYSVSMLEFRPHYGNQYQISPTEIHIEADVCNPSFFPATFNKYEISAFYNSELIEQAQIQGNMISPKTMSTLDGVFALNTDTVMKLKQDNATFDPTLATITTTVDAPIFGAIPFSVVKQYTAQQFQDVLKNGPPGAFSCY